MAKIDQTTRRGRIVVVFIGGIIIFGGLTLAGLYLSNQRRIQFEATQNGGSQITTPDESENSEETPPESEEQGGGSTEPDSDTPAPENEESTQEVASTGPSDDMGAGESLPATGPSDENVAGSPSEIPATGPESLWIIALIGFVVVAYLSFEYRRSRLAFQRAALRR